MKKLALRLREWLLGLPLALRPVLARNRFVRALAYRVRNAYTFASLYQHDRMLHDSMRVDAYHAAIEKYVARGDVVIDLGAGTGVLSAFAAQQGAEVHAIEHGPIIEAAEAVMAANGLTGVSLHRMHSSAFDPGHRVDAIIHEQIGDALFDEAVVRNIVDLRDRLLKPGGRILPAKLELFIEPIQLTDARRIPYAWEARLYGLDFSALQELEPKQPQSYHVGSLAAAEVDRYLCEPEAVLRVDLQTVAVDGLPTEISYSRPAATDGIFDGYAVFWVVAFDDEISFTNRPDGQQTSWGIPFLRIQSREVHAGETIDLGLTADALDTPKTWRW